MHRPLISGFVARPGRRDAEVRQIGKLQALPADQASVPQVNGGAIFSVPHEVPNLIHSCGRIVSCPRRGTRHLPGRSDDDVRSRITRGHVQTRMPTARRAAAEGTTVMAVPMNGIVRSARPALEKA